LTDQHGQLETEHRELRIKFFELKQQHDELVDKMRYFTKVSHFAFTLQPFEHSCWNWFYWHHIILRSYVQLLFDAHSAAYTFSALTLFVGWQEEHWAYKTECCFDCC